MQIEGRRTDYRQIEAMRDMYRHEMNCQIIHDSIHFRPGWTIEYLLSVGEATIGYGSVAVSGPWKDKPTLYEFYVLPKYRLKLFEAFSVLLRATAATMI